MNERDKEFAAEAEAYADRDFKGEVYWREAYESKLIGLIREDERKEIRAQMTRLVIVPTLTHGTLVKLTDVDAAIRARGNT